MAIEVKVNEASGLRYIRGTLKTMVCSSDDNGVMVTNEEFDAWDRDKTLLSQVMGLVKNQEYSGYKFSYTMDTGSPSKKLPLNYKNAPVPAAPPPLSNPLAKNQESKPKIVFAAPGEISNIKAFNSKVLLVAEELEDLTPEELAEAKLTSTEIEQLAVVQEELDALQPTKPLTMKEKVLAFLRGKRPEKQKKKAQPAGKFHESVFVMLVVIIVVGIGSMLMSGYHIFAYIKDGGRPELVAIITGVIMTLFSAIAFTSTRYFASSPRWQDWIISFLFGFFGVIVVMFAMFSTMKVNNDQFKAGYDAKITAVVEQSVEVKSAANTQTFLQTELDRLAKDIDRYQKEADSWRYKWQAEVNKKTPDADLKWQYWSNFSQAKKKAEQARTDRKPYEDKAMASTGSDVKAQDDVKQKAEDATIFGMLHHLFGISQETVMFIVYVIPAVFYDLMCPFALTVGMMLYDRISESSRKEEEE